MCTTFPFAETLSNGKVFGLLTSGGFPHDRHSPGRDTTAQACRFSCFFCAAYGLLLTQTRTWCSNSASRAIAMLEKTAKISPNVCAGISLSNECGHVENSYVFINDTDGRIWGRSCVQLSPNKRQCQQSRTAHLHRLTTFHNQSADISASEGRPLADFRRIGEHSDCFANTV